MSTSPPARVPRRGDAPEPGTDNDDDVAASNSVASRIPLLRPPKADSGLAVWDCEEVLGGETRSARSSLLQLWTLLIAAALSSGRHIVQRYLPEPGAFGGLARMRNAAMTTRGTATILPAAKMVENDSPIRSRNGPMPNAATP